jgi:broad specificity phosphatase PhoE
MKRLILVKHSLPEIVETIPAREWTLSDGGRARARKLAERLLPFQPEVIASSVESKARETASILAEYLGLAVHAVGGLHEHDRSSSPYYSEEEFRKLVREFFARPDTLVFGNESAVQSLGRFRAAVEGILKSHADENLIIVSHGTVIALFASWLTGCDGYVLWQALGLPSFIVLDLQSKSMLRTDNVY